MARLLQLFLIFFTFFPLQLFAQNEILPVDKISKGMKGYGDTIFEGNKHEKFDVEVLGVLHNALTKQDLIIVKCKHPILEDSGIIAGMSGSPVYINDKLIGAVAYGWTFSKEPIAGVTPIESMYKELNRPFLPDQNNVESLSQNNKKISQNMENKGFKSQFVPLETPLIFSGIGKLGRFFISEKLGELGYFVAETVGGGKKVSSLPVTTNPFSPGDGIGIQLVKGDVDVTAIGTVTAVKNNKILAFGHPLFGMGQLRLPATTTNIITVLKSVERSFKLGEADAEAGTLLQDRQSTIIVDPHKRAPMIPVEVILRDNQRNNVTKYNFSVADHPVITPIFAIGSLIDILSEGCSDAREATVNVKAQYVIKNKNNSKTINLSDMFYSVEGVVDPWTFLSLTSIDALFQLLINPFEHVKVDKISYELNVVWGSKSAEITNVKINKSEVYAGEKVKLIVNLRTIDSIEKQIEVPLDIPLFAGDKNIEIEVAGGNNATLELAPPESLDDLIDVWQKQYSSSSIVTTIFTSEKGIGINGKLLNNLPPSVIDTIAVSNGQLEGREIKGNIKSVISTPYILNGRKKISLEVKRNIGY